MEGRRDKENAESGLHGRSPHDSQQTVVRLTNGECVTDEATKRDIDLLRHCERAASEWGVTLSVAIDEGTSARRVAGGSIACRGGSLLSGIPAGHRCHPHYPPSGRRVIESRHASGVGATYVKNSRLNLKRFTGR